MQALVIVLLLLASAVLSPLSARDGQDSPRIKVVQQPALIVSTLSGKNVEFTLSVVNQCDTPGRIDIFQNSVPIVVEMPMYFDVGARETKEVRFSGPPPSDPWKLDGPGINDFREFVYAFSGGPSCPPMVSRQPIVVQQSPTTEAITSPMATIVVERAMYFSRALDEAIDPIVGDVLSRYPPSVQRAQSDASGQTLGGGTDGTPFVVPGSGNAGDFASAVPPSLHANMFARARVSSERWQPSRTMPPLTVYLTSLGRSTGEAFTLTALNHGRDPVSINADNLVLEPVTGVTAQTTAKEIADHRGGRATTTLTAYCLEFLKTPPVAGAVFRLAARPLADQFSGFRHLIAATRRMQRYGLLPPEGGDARAYFHSIRQWAIWTQEQSFDEKRFGDAFVQHSRKNAEQAGRQWTAPFETAARGLVPGRWKAVQFALQEAARFERARSTGGRGR